MSNKTRLQDHNIELQNLISSASNLPAYENIDTEVNDYTSLLAEAINEIQRKTTIKGGNGKYVWAKYNKYQGSLPEGYTELVYIRSTGTQQFDTGVIPDDNTVIDFTFSNLVLPMSTDYGILGVAWGNYSLLYNSVSAIKWYASGGGNTTKSISTSSTNNVIIKSTGITINGVETSILCSSSYAANSIWICNTGDNSGASFKGRMDIYPFKIYNGTTLIRDYIPALNPTGSVGLYDVVNNTFGTGNGTEEFIAGDAKNYSDLIEYIVSDNETAYPENGEQDGYWYKVVATQLVPELFGCTKIAIDKFAFTDRTATSTSITHSLGEMPKFAFINTDVATKQTWDLTQCVITHYVSRLGNYADSTLYYHADTDGFHSTTTTSARLTDTTIIAGGSYPYYMTGVEYTLITMV